jgi:hypothetical protein
VGHIDGMKLRLIAANDSLFIRSFGVAHTHFAPVFVPCSPRMMTDDFITADFATGTASKLYRFHYNLLAAVPVIWSAMKRSSSAQITGNPAFKLFRQPNNLSRRFGLTF